MKKITFLLLLLTLAFASCQNKYPDLEDGIYAEFVTNKGTFIAKLYNKDTPITVANFVSLAEGTNQMVDTVYKGKKFFNGLVFHRVIKDFMIQGGDPNGDGTGNPGYSFPDEFADSLQFDRKGLLAMANSGPATNGSQFFITLKETPWLNNKHTIFGEIVKGQEIVDSIGVVETTKPGDKPVNPITINEVHIIKKGNANIASFTNEMEKLEKEKLAKEEKFAEKAKEQAAEFAKIEGKADSLPSGLKIYIEEKGNGVKPKEGDQIYMNYEGYFSDGSLFDTNKLEAAEAFEKVDERRKAADQYGPTISAYGMEARLVPGLKEGLMLLKVGDKATLFIPSYLGYGEHGYPPAIPGDTDLVLKVEVVGIVE